MHENWLVIQIEIQIINSMLKVSVVQVNKNQDNKLLTCPNSSKIDSSSSFAVRYKHDKHNYVQ